MFNSGNNVTEDQAVQVLVQNLVRVAEGFFADPQYLKLFEAATGHSLDSADVSSDVAHFKIPMFGGAMLASAYLRLACKEVAEARIDRFWDKLMHSNINELYGLKKYCEDARAWISGQMRDKNLMRFVGGRPTGNDVEDKMNGIKGLGGLWLMTELAPQLKCSSTSQTGMLFMAMHARPIFTFTLLLEGMLDELYGEPIPLPAQKKGFFSSLFGC